MSLDFQGKEKIWFVCYKFAYVICPQFTIHWASVLMFSLSCAW
jgi:hypothetical protein